MNEKLSLKRSQIVRKKAHFTDAFAKSPRVLSWYKHPVSVKILVMQPKPPESIQVAFLVSKRLARKAVQRNKVKRWLREAYRQQQVPLQKALLDKNYGICLFWQSRQLPKQGFHEINTAVEELISRILSHLHNSGPTNEDQT